MNNNFNFMISDINKTIYKTKKETEIKFSFEKIFDNKAIINKNSLENLFIIKSSSEGIDHFPFIIIGETIRCTLDKDLQDKVYEENENKEKLFLDATPICFYFENLQGWIYTTNGEWDLTIEKTENNFPTLKKQNIYKMAKTSISKELGKNHKAELLIPETSVLFHSKEDLMNYYQKSGNHNGDIFHDKTIKYSYLEGWKLEFMILDFGEGFLCKTNDFDQLFTSKRGGVIIQPIQIIGIGQEKMGWLPMTTSRIRYGLETLLEK